MDPPNAFYQVFRGWHLLYLHRETEAIAECRNALAIEPENSSGYMCLWGAYYRKSMPREALAAAHQFFSVLKDNEAIAALDRGAAAGGYRTAMRMAGEVLEGRSRSQYVSGMRIARLYAHAGERDRALQWLEKAYQRREVNLAHINVGWDWDDLRPDPRFTDLLRRMNFPQ